MTQTIDTLEDRLRYRLGALMMQFEAVCQENDDLRRKLAEAEAKIPSGDEEPTGS